MKLELTHDQYSVIRSALESYYYICKDEGKSEEMDIITELENYLIKQCSNT